MPQAVRRELHEPHVAGDVVHLEALDHAPLNRLGGHAGSRGAVAAPTYPPPAMNASVPRPPTPPADIPWGSAAPRPPGLPDYVPWPPPPPPPGWLSLPPEAAGGPPSLPFPPPPPPPHFFDDNAHGTMGPSASRTPRTAVRAPVSRSGSAHQRETPAGRARSPVASMSRRSTSVGGGQRGGGATATQQQLMRIRSLASAAPDHFGARLHAPPSSSSALAWDVAEAPQRLSGVHVPKPGKQREQPGASVPTQMTLRSEERAAQRQQQRQELIDRNRNNAELQRQRKASTTKAPTGRPGVGTGGGVARTRTPSGTRATPRRAGAPPTPIGRRPPASHLRGRPGEHSYYVDPFGGQTPFSNAHGGSGGDGSGNGVAAGGGGGGAVSHAEEAALPLPPPSSSLRQAARSDVVPLSPPPLREEEGNGARPTTSDAEEYLRRIESMYSEMREAYTEFKRNPHAFVAATKENSAVMSPTKATARQRSPFSAAHAADQSRMFQASHVSSPPPSRPSPVVGFAGRRTAVPASYPDVPLPPHSSGIDEPSEDTRRLRAELDRLERRWEDLEAGNSGRSASRGDPTGVPRTRDGVLDKVNAMLGRSSSSFGG